MSRDDIQKLLGGYATGTLTAEEQQALFEAALDDQELFDTLAREQALRDLLRDPAAKTQLLAALDQRPARWYEGLVRGWRPLAAAAAMAGVGAIAVVVWQNGRSPKTVLVAQVSQSGPASNPVSTPPAERSPALPAAANPGQQPAGVQDINGPAMRDKDAASGRMAKASPAKVGLGAEGAAEEDRRAKEKVAKTTERKEVADLAAPLPAAPPTSPRTFASGFREGAAPPGVRDSFGELPSATQPQLPDPKAAPRIRSEMGGGTVGGVLGGNIGGKPGSAPSPPAAPPPPKTEAQPAQSAQAQGTPSQSATQAKPAQSGPAQFGQQGAPPPSAQFQLGQSQVVQSQLERARLAGPAGATAETVQVTAAASSLDAVSSQDVKSLFYGYLTDSLNAPGARGGVGGGGGKKAADQPEKTPAGRQAMAVNTIAANTRAQARPLNLGVRYSVLRKTAGGTFEEVDPNSVKAGDTLKLQLMPNDSGSLQVQGRSGDGLWRDVTSLHVAARNTYTTSQLKPGETELQVTLMRAPVTLGGVSLRDDKSGGIVSQQSTTEPATYVVAGPASPLLRFTITLNYK